MKHSQRDTKAGCGPVPSLQLFSWPWAAGMDSICMDRGHRHLSWELSPLRRQPGRQLARARQLRPRLQQSQSRPRRYRLLPRPYRHRQRSQQPLPPRIGTYGTARRDGCHRTSDASAVSAGSGADRNEGSLIGPPGTSYGTRSTSYFARYEYDKIDNGGFL